MSRAGVCFRLTTGQTDNPININKLNNVIISVIKPPSPEEGEKGIKEGYNDIIIYRIWVEKIVIQLL